MSVYLCVCKGVLSNRTSFTCANAQKCLVLRLVRGTKEEEHRGTQRDREGHRGTQRDREGIRERDRERGTEREAQTERGTETDRDKQTERGGQRGTETERVPMCNPESLRVDRMSSDTCLL